MACPAPRWRVPALGALLAAGFASLMPAADDAPPPPPAAEVVEAAAAQPLASLWFPQALLSWSPATDPDAAFNRSRVPLAARFSDPAQNVNAHARPQEARVAALVGFARASGNPSQGSSVFDYYALNYWQYIDALVFFGGSSSEGLILAPNPTVIDAGHRNGVPVLGNIFLPPGAFGGQIQWTRDLVQQSGARFPVGDKLIEVAKHYGFDGWFINAETEGGDAALATRMRDFVKYLQANSSLRIIWYDSMVESGAIAWQNRLSSQNDSFFQDGTTLVSDQMFLNFAWSSSGLAASRTLAGNLGRSPYDLYAGADVQANGFNTSVNWAGIFPEGQPHVVSLGFYRPEWTFKSSATQAEFYQKDSRFWIGANGDPSNTTTSNAWKGVAHYVPASSPVTRIPFVTNFNTGQGHLFAVNGQVRATREWNNLSLQDVLPTWRWVLRSSGARLTPTLDWSDAYYGGTSLRVTGSLSATNDLRLFQTRLLVAGDTNLRLAFKTGRNGAATAMQVALGFQGDPGNLQFLDVGSASSAGWNTRTFSLSPFAGKTLTVIALRFSSPTPIANYDIRVGQIAVRQGSGAVPAAPSAVAVAGKTESDDSHAALRLTWTASPSAVYYYNVYRLNSNGSSTYLGGTPNNAYFVPEVVREGSEASTTIQVEAVSPDFRHSTRATAAFGWDGAGSAVVHETESLVVAASSGDVHRVAVDAGYSNGRGTILEADAAGDFVTYTVNVPQAGTYDIRVGLKRLTNRGTWQFASNGVNHGPAVDGFAAAGAFTEADLGNVTFTTSGDKAFRFTVTGRNTSSSGFWIALDYIKLTPQ